MERRYYMVLKYPHTVMLLSIILFLLSINIQWGCCQRVIGTQCNNDTDGQHKLYLVAMGPFPNPVEALQPSWKVGPRLVTGALLALKHINSNTSVLPDYKLCMIEADSGCNIESKMTISVVRDVFNRERQVVGIIGPACSGAALLLAPLNARKNVSIINITPSATSPLVDHPENDNTFATVSTTREYTESFDALLEDRNWQNIATMHDEERVFFKTTFQNFKNRVQKRIQFSTPIHDDEDNNDTRSFPLDELKESQSRVVFTFVAPGTAPKILCLAYNKSMSYPTYQWIFHDRTRKQIIKPTVFIMDGIEYNCTKEDMQRAAHGVILNTYDLKQDDEIDVIGMNYDEYHDEHEKTFQQYLANINDNATRDLYNVSSESWANPYYDATWAMALALHEASMKGVNLSTYQYNQPNETEIIRQQLFKLRFNGSSGPIFFNEGSRSTNTVIEIKYVDTETSDSEMEHTVLLGKYALGKLTLLANVSDYLIADTFATREIRINIGISVIIMMISVILFVVCALLQAAFIGWHYHRSIKATSPNISHLIFSGCYLFTISVFVFAIQETFNYPTEVYATVYGLFCSIISWCMLLGYSLIFGTVLAKAWRVYRLFKHFRNESPGILLTDNALISFVILLLIVDTCLLITWNLVDPLVHEHTPKQDIETIDGIPTIPFLSRCDCKNLTIWVGVIVAYKGFIALALFLFSILNRKIRRKDFKHTKKINILIYALIMVIGPGIPLYFLLRHIDIHVGFIILCFILTLTVVMCCLMLFIPPVLPVIKEKMGLKQDASFKRELRRKLSTVSTLSFFGSDNSEEYQ